jgi:hypothetical protein
MNRPSSGYSTRPSSGGTARSFVSTTAGHQQQQSSTSAMISMSTRSAAVASVKGDILLLQRMIDKISPSSSSSQQQQQNATNSFFPQKDGLFEVEQILAHEFPPLLPGDEVLAADMHAKLLELFVQRLNLGCLEVLTKIDPDSVENVSLVSRTSAINTLLQKIAGDGSGGSNHHAMMAMFSGNNNSSDKSRRGQNQPSSSSSLLVNHHHHNAQTQTHSIGGLSAPEITDFQALLKEQREIQSQMKQTLTHRPQQQQISGDGVKGSIGTNNNIPPIGNATATTTVASSSKTERSQIRILKEQLEEANKTLAEIRSESSSIQMKLSRSETQRLALQQELKDYQDQKHHHSSSSSPLLRDNNINSSSSKSMNAKQQQSGNTINNSSSNANNNSSSTSIMMNGSRTRKNTSEEVYYNDDDNQQQQQLDASGSTFNNNNINNDQNSSSSVTSAADRQVAMLNKMTPEAAYAASLAATVGFYRLEPEILSQVGLNAILTDTNRFVPDRQYCEQIYSKVSTVVSDVLAQIVAADELLANNNNNNNNNLFNNAVNRLAANNSSLLTANANKSAKSTKKDKNENSPEALAAKIGAMWWVLEKQNATVQAMQLLLVKQHDELEKGEKDKEALDKRTKRMISVLEEKLGHAKSVVQRLMEENEMLVANGNNNNHGDGGRDSRASQGSNDNPLSRSASQRIGGGGGAMAGSTSNVRSSLDDPSSEETRKGYEKNELRLQRRILELEHTNSESHAFVEQAKLNAAATNRELKSLKSRVQSLEKELDGKRSSEEKAVTEATKLRNEREGNKKEIREKSISQTEVQQKVNRLEVELHISQNIVSDLRQREIQLEKASRDAKDCQDILKQKMIGERETHARELARIKEEHRASKHEVVVANQILADERQKAVANEREIERLRGLDLQLEALQQNFANYAGAKQAQKEAHDEEERALQACVELIGQDVFALPFDESQGEEEVELLLRRLRDSEESMAAEERTRDTLRNTVVGFKDERSGRKQLATLMQRRYNAIQIFACQERLRQLQLEQQLLLLSR